MTGKQHAQIHRKLLLRKSLMRAAGPRLFTQGGAAFVPFCGDGDIAFELYHDRLPIYAADLDPARTATAQQRMPEAQIVTGDCDVWPFGQINHPIAIGDFDAYSYPYASFRGAWENPDWCDVAVVLFTDSQRQSVTRMGRWIEPDGTRVDVSDAPLAARRHAYNAWLTRHCRPWLDAVASDAGYTVIKRSGYLRGHMLYWGAVLDRTRGTHAR